MQNIFKTGTYDYHPVPRIIPTDIYSHDETLQELHNEEQQGLLHLEINKVTEEE